MREDLPVPKVVVVVARTGVIALLGVLPGAVEISDHQIHFGPHFPEVVRDFGPAVFQAIEDLLGLLVAMPLVEHLHEHAVESGIAVAIDGGL